jgi:hypothetical protein
MFTVVSVVDPDLKVTDIPAQTAPSEAVAVKVMTSPSVRVVTLVASVNVAWAAVTATFTVLLVIT